MNNSNKYQRMHETYDIVGFVVNVHDPINFDIDFDIPQELHEKYINVITNKYTYQDLTLDLQNCDSPKIGVTYRCRLKGIGINQLNSHIHAWKRNQLCVEIKQLIDRTDGWVSCTLSDIDIYRRLLIDMIINTHNGPINLCEYLLMRMTKEENPIFHPYKK